MVLSSKRLSIALDQELVVAIEKAITEEDSQQALKLLETLSKLVRVARTCKCGLPRDQC